MKVVETILTAILVVVGFLLSDYIAGQLYIDGAFERLLVRLGLQAQFIALIYLFFESRDNARRIKKLETDIYDDNIPETASGSHPDQTAGD